MITYKPESRRNESIVGVLSKMSKNILIHRELIWQLFKRDFLAGYRKSYLGLLWIFFGPIFGIASWVIMNKTGILSPGELSIPYPAYVLVSSSFWGFFLGGYNAATETLNSGAGFILQVKYPHETLLVKQLLQHLSNFIISFVLAIAALLLFKVVPSAFVFLTPLLLLPLLILAAGMGLIASVISVVSVDISRIANLALGLSFYITPIIYSSQSNDGILSRIAIWNPLTHLVGTPRDIILFGTTQNDIMLYALWSIVAILFFALACKLFYISEFRVIEKML